MKESPPAQQVHAVGADGRRRLPCCEQFLEEHRDWRHDSAVSVDEPVGLAPVAGLHQPPRRGTANLDRTRSGTRCSSRPQTVLGRNLTCALNCKINIEIEAFGPLESIDAIQLAEGYYLQPDGQVAAKPYKRLRLALERSSKVAIAEYAWSGRERLGLLRVRGEAIVLHAMRWPDEIRDPSELAPGATEVTDEEISEAEHLIDRMTRADVEGPDFTDRYTDAIAKVIEAKRESRPLPEAPEPAAAPARVVDLMAALQESVRKTQAARVRTPQRPRDA